MSQHTSQEVGSREDAFRLPESDRAISARSVAEPLDAGVVSPDAATVGVGEVARLEEESEFTQHSELVHDLLDRGDQPCAVMRPVDPRANPSNGRRFLLEAGRLKGLLRQFEAGAAGIHRLNEDLFRAKLQQAPTNWEIES
jgi:hypothetical protein